MKRRLWIITISTIILGCSGPGEESGLVSPSNLNADDAQTSQVDVNDNTPDSNTDSSENDNTGQGTNPSPPPVLEGLVLSVDTQDILLGESIDYSVLGVYSDATRIDVKDSAVVSFSNSGVASVNSERLNGDTIGSTLLNVELDGVNTTLALSVYSANLVSISLNSTQVELASNGGYQLEATALYDNGISSLASSGVSWSSSDESIVTVDVNGLVAPVASGSAQIVANFKGMNSQAVVNVNTTTILDIELWPLAGKGVVGSTQTFSATAILDDNTRQDITHLVNWESSNTGALAFAGSSANLLSEGTVNLSATYSGISKSTSFLVEEKTLQGLTIDGAQASYAVGLRDHFSVVGNYSDGSTSDLSDMVIWSSSDNAVASISGGELRALALGSANISASVGGISQQVEVNVTDASLSTIIVNTNQSLISSGIDQRLTAAGIYSDGSTQDITELVTWSSSDESIAIMSNSAGNRGYLSNVYAGGSIVAVDITASLDGVSSQQSLTVNPGTITAVEVNYGNVSLNPFQTAQYKAYARFSDGASVEITDLAVWSSSSESIAVISNSVSFAGEVSAISNGQTSISASYKTFTSVTSTLNVSDAASQIEELGTGLLASYYSGNSFDTLVGQRLDAQVYFNWGRGQAPLGAGDYFSVQWRGQIKGKSTGDCTIASRTDDGFRLTIGSTTLIDVWFPHAPRWDYAYNVAFESGVKQDIAVDFYENGGYAVAELYWQCEGDTALEPIPMEYLYPQEG